MTPRSVALLSFVAGVALAWAVTISPLPALSPDSASYLGAAESLAHGEGLRIPMAKWWADSDTEPLRHFPPAFPLLIALPTKLGAAALSTARVIESLSFGAMLAIAALIVSRATASVWGGVLVVLLLMCTPAIVQDFVPVLSEPLFLCLVALLVYLLSSERERPLLLGLIAAIGAMVRYAGISLTATCVLLCLVQPGSLWERARRALLAGLPTLVALVAWQRVSGQFRKYGVHTAGLPEEFAHAWETLGIWLSPALPAGVLKALLACAALALCAVLAANVLRRELPQLARLVWTVAVYSFVYTGVVVSARSFADPGIEFDWRTLSPLMLTGEIALAAMLTVRLQDAQRAQRWGIGALIALWMLGSVVEIKRMIVKARDHGYGYESPAWQGSAVAAWLRAQDAGLTFYTNNPAALWHLAQRKSRLLPTPEDPHNAPPIASVFERGPSAIVQFPHGLEATLAIDDLVRGLNFAQVLKSARGNVWVRRPNSSQSAH